MSIEMKIIIPNNNNNEELSQQHGQVVQLHRRQKRRVSRVLQRFRVAMKFPQKWQEDNTSIQNTYNNKNSVVTPSTAQNSSTSPRSFRESWTNRLSSRRRRRRSSAQPMEHEQQQLITAAAATNSKSRPFAGRFSGRRRRRRLSSIKSNITAVIPEDRIVADTQDLSGVEITSIPDMVIVEEDDDNVSRMTSEFYWKLQFDENDPVRHRSLLPPRTEEEEVSLRCNQSNASNNNQQQQQIHIVNNINNNHNNNTNSNINFIIIGWMIVLSIIVLTDTKTLWKETIVPQIRAFMMLLWSLTHKR